MKRGRSIWKLGWRLAVGTALLVWIFHSIFMLEGKRAWSQQQEAHPAWETVARSEQWSFAWGHGPGELWSTIRLVSPSGLTASILFMGLILLLNVIRWQMVLSAHGFKLSFARASEISLVAHFFNSFLLGSTGGDLLKAYYAARETHHKKTEAVVTVVLDRLLGLFSLLLFAALMMLPNLSLLASHRRLTALAGFVLLMFVACGVIVALSLWGGLSRSWPRARIWLKRLPKAERIERALEACRHFGRDWKLLAKVFAISMILNVCCVLQVLSLARGLDLRVDALALFVIVPMIVCISALPITPSGLGVRENLYVWMLAVPAINVEATSALSLSLLAYAGFLLWSVVGGVVYVARKERDQLAEIAETEEAVAEN